MLSKKDLKGCGLLLRPKIKKEDAQHDLIFGAEEQNDPINWKPYLPIRERQWALPFCGTFSRLNCGEAFANYHGLNINLSDRYLGVVSKTSKSGNYLDNISDAFRKIGCPAENECEFRDEWLYNPTDFWDDIFNLSDVDPMARKYFGGNYSWVPTEILRLKNALAFSPLQLGIPVGETYNDAIVTPPKTIRGYHAVCNYWIDDKYIYIQDSISEEFKKLTINYPVNCAMSFRDLPDDWREKQDMKPRLLYKGDQYIIDTNEINFIPDEETLYFLFDKGWADQKEPLSVDSLADYKIGRAIPSVKVDDVFKSILPILKDAYEKEIGTFEKKAGVIGTFFGVLKLWSFLKKLKK